MFLLFLPGAITSLIKGRLPRHGWPPALWGNEKGLLIFYFLVEPLPPANKKRAGRRAAESFPHER